MPIYEYDCPQCGRFEQIQKASDKALTTCPTCSEKGKKSQVKRCVSAAAFHLKGSGWYKTDYSGGSSKASSSASSDASSAAGSSEGASSKSIDSRDSKTASAAPSPDRASPKKAGCGSGGCGCH